MIINRFNKKFYNLLLVFLLIGAGCDTNPSEQGGNKPTTKVPRGPNITQPNGTSGNNNGTSGNNNGTSGNNNGTSSNGTFVPPPPPPIAVHVQAYLDKYVTEFGDDAAALDIAKVHPASSKPVLSDARCQEYFGADQAIDYQETAGRNDEERLVEYLAGQVLTALSFASTRVCHYKDAANQIQSLYREVKRLKDTEINKVKLANNDKTKGGVLVNGAYIHTIFQFHAPRINKWLVAETDYNNYDYLSYLLVPGLLSSFAYDFQNAGKEVGTLSTAGSRSGLPPSNNDVLGFIFSDINNKTFNSNLMTTEMLFGFIKQMKDLIADHAGASVLSSILKSPLVIAAKTDFGVATNLDVFHDKIKSQIKTLIDKLEDMYGLNVAGGWNDFDARETLRENLANNLNLLNIAGFNKKLFRLALLGKYYLDDPSDTTELTNLSTHSANVEAIERARLTDLAGYNIYNPITPELTFSYPTNKKYYIVEHNNFAPGSKQLSLDYINNKLNAAGFTKIDSIPIDAIDLIARVDVAIVEKASLIVVGYDHIGDSISNHNQLPAIYNRYEVLNATKLPRYIVRVNDHSDNENSIKKDAAKSLYKNSANNFIKHISINHFLTEKSYNFSTDFHLGVGKDGFAGSFTRIDGSTINIDGFLQFIIDNAN